MQEQMQFTPLPIPPDFPVEWASPKEGYLLWTRERTHWPAQITPLEFSLWEQATEGMNAAYAFYSMANKSLIRRFNTYYYNTMVLEELKPEEMEAVTQEIQAKLGKVMADLDTIWKTDWLVELKGHLAFWEDFDLKQASMSELLEHLEESVDRTIRLWDLHNRIQLPVSMAMSMFDDFYQDLFEDATPFDAFQLLEGFENKTVESGLGLWKLSRQALLAPEATEALQATTTDAVMTQLASTDAGRTFLVKLKGYLQEFGHRGEKWGWQYPTWLEDPTTVIHNLQDYITQPDRDLDAEQEGIVQKRERRVAEARKQLQNYPQTVVQQFEFWLKAAQAAVVIKEDHTYWLDFRTSYQVRQVLLAFGDHFADGGVIAQRDDIFYLTLDELQETAEKLPNLTRKALVVERQAEMEKFATVQPPNALGSMPPSSLFSDPSWSENPLIRLFTKLDGGMSKPSQNSDILQGNPGSPGKVQGVARIIRTLQEADKVQQGEILVTETTAPPWTPLFATVAAVVTETGGILCHSAVVAREYGIPAVVGADGAMMRIQEGQRIEVDGEAGIVKILSD